MAKAETFITETDLYSFISKSELKTIKTVIQAGPPEVTNISQAMKSVCSLAYSYLSAAYPVPFDDNSPLITEALKMNCAKICAYNLSALIPALDKNVLDMRRDQNSYATRWLEDIRDKRVRLETVAEGTAPSSSKYHFSSTQRLDSDFH